MEVPIYKSLFFRATAFTSLPGWLMKATQALLVLALIPLCGYGPSAEEQRAMDQQKCSGYGFQPGSNAYAHCLMNVSLQRESEQAADQRAAADRWAADPRANAALAAAKNASDQ